MKNNKIPTLALMEAASFCEVPTKQKIQQTAGKHSLKMKMQRYRLFKPYGF